MKKTIYFILLIWGYAVFSQPARYKMNKYKPKEQAKIDELLKGQKIKFQPLEILPDFDLLLEQRLIFMPGRTARAYNQKYKYMGISIGNGLFIDSDYNVGLSLEKYFKTDLNNKSKYRIIIKKSGTVKNLETIEYVRELDSLAIVRDKKNIKDIQFVNDEIHFKKYKSIIRKNNGSLGYFGISKEGQPVNGEITRTGNMVNYNLDLPSSQIEISENKISAEVPSDFFYSDVYEFRAFHELEIKHDDDIITITGGKGGDKKVFKMIQNNDGLFIISGKKKIYRIFKEKSGMIHVIEISRTGEKEILTIEIIL